MVDEIPYRGPILTKQMEQTSIGENSSCFKAIHLFPGWTKFVFLYEIHELLAPRIDKMQSILLRRVIGGK